jgi:hypothetical protein
MKHDILERAAKRKAGARALSDAGILFESKNDGAHLIIHARPLTIDYWPGTDLWIVRGNPIKHYGFRGLMKELA